MEKKSQQKYICLDRDGTILKLIHHLSDVREAEILPGVLEGCLLLKKQGFRFGIFTNQSVLSRGLSTWEQVDSIHNYILFEFAKFKIPIDFVYVCPHLPEMGCVCRKPSVELGLKAIAQFGIDTSKSFMIGDSETDIEFGINLNLNTIRISKGEISKADFSAENFSIAVNIILEEINE
jgi:D-glycero-D-manno-heptose 1,7-bisphosphate phosphatase